MPDQLSLDFSSEEKPSDKGLEAWRADRMKAIRQLADLQGLPIGHLVRVDFENGPGLEGRLMLDEEGLFIPSRKNPGIALRIGTHAFHADEIASCVRLD
jgi:hypothetical protein